MVIMGSTNKMEHFKINGIWEDADVYQFFNLEEAKQHTTLDRNYPEILKDFEDILNKTWVDDNGKHWTIFGLEDNQAWDDYYWLIRDKEGNIKNLLANDSNLYKNII